MVIKTLFLEAPYKEEIELSEEVLSRLKGRKVGLFASVQFVGRLEVIKKQLRKTGAQVITTKLPRASQEGQLLGCHVDLEPADVDAFLYIGDGKFHPLALIYSQKDRKEEENSFKEVVCYDPVQKKMNLLTIDDINKTQKKYKASMVKFLSSDTVGVIITLKPGQERYQDGLKLKDKYPHKKFYYFLDNNISFDRLENFSFIDVWVNTACPRISLDEQGRFVKGVVNLNDVLK